MLWINGSMWIQRMVWVADRGFKLPIGYQRKMNDQVYEHRLVG